MILTYGFDLQRQLLSAILKRSDFKERTSRVARLIYLR